MKLHRVTVTGFDAYTNVKRLEEIGVRYPFMEVGILLSKSKEGKEARYPHQHIIHDFLRRPNLIRVAGHLCGSWVRNILEGGYEFANDRPNLFASFDRLQLNISDVLAREPDMNVALDGSIARTYRTLRRPLIIQVGGLLQHQWLTQLKSIMPYNILFDRSGGRGTLPAEWPAFVEHCGYAGGLSPDNLKEQLEILSGIVGDQSIWIDVESGVRTNDDFDLDKVERFLEIAKPYTNY